MSFMEKIKQIVNVDEDNYYDNDAVGEDYEEYDDYDTGREEEEEKPEPSVREAHPQENANRVVRISNAAAQLQVVLVKPDRYEQATVTEIADHVNDKRTVVLNLEAANRESSRRLLDFLSGVAYANGGAISPLSNNTYIIVPYNVEFTGDLADELESNGVFF
ncbi:MAG TPA: cell division protein SepF [Candidatus Fimivicinus intestinavium]|nr:cell division protein SepF [Candidatus Fimivicinus intestinavium]